MQEKNITFPTDAKLLVKIVDWCQKVSRAEGLVLRQTYRNEMKELKRVMRFRGRAKSKKAVARADRRLRTIAGRLCRELDRLLDADSPWRERLKISLMFINGEKLDGHKIYSLHEPDVVCIAKGKDRVKYEFGNKVSIIRTWSGLIIGAKSFRNEYDGHTIDPALEQVGRLYPHPIKILAGDRGYRGKKQSGRTMIEIPGTPKATDSPYRRLHKRHACRRRIQLQKSHEGSFCDYFYNVPTIVGGNNSPPRDALCKISPVVGFCERKGTKPWNSRQSESLPNPSF